MTGLNVTGHSVLVTGANGGIGRGIVESFLSHGANIIAHHRADKTSSQQLKNSFSDPTRVAIVTGDIRNETDCQDIVAQATAAFGTLDALVNNAGIQPVQSLAEMSVADLNAVISVNLTGTFAMTQAAAQAMRGQGGSITHIASVEGSLPAANHAHYATSKAAVIMHARAAAREYGAWGIRVNTVSPGLIDTGGLAESWPPGYESWCANDPLGRTGTPADVGAACVFLASPLASWISGHDLVVDGGMSAVQAWGE